MSVPQIPVRFTILKMFDYGHASWNFFTSNVLDYSVRKFFLFKTKIPESQELFVLHTNALKTYLNFASRIREVKFRR